MAVQDQCDMLHDIEMHQFVQPCDDTKHCFLLGLWFLSQSFLFAHL